MKFYYIGLLIVFVSCTHTVSIKNEKEGKLTAKYQLVIGGEKRILLDDETAPKPPYMQTIKGKSGEQILTFLNPHRNAIYFYDYEKSVYTKKIEYEREGPDGIFNMTGYFIKNMDSIYVYDKRMVELSLTDSSGRVKHRISLRNNRSDREWSRYYPQYVFNTISPLFETHGKLILPGMSPFSIADSLIRKFHFAACVDLKSDKLEFIHTYPEELYGSNTNWQDPFFMQPYPELSPTGEFIYSFPVSHDVYITQWDSYQTVYAGANAAKTIHSIDDSRSRTPNEIVLAHLVQQDFYLGIRHDPYRHVYYRLMWQGIPGATIGIPVWKKPVVVIIMDEQFNYLGEKVLGTAEEWNWFNTFVTPEGLTVEYIDPEKNSGEEYLILKTWTIKEI